jgi:hypothetical protein
MTVVSMCHISSGPLVRSPAFGFAGCIRSRGRRQPYVRTRRYQVDALAFLVLFAGAASGALQQDETVTIHVSDARPLASAIKELEDRYGWVITYEDPRYVDASDVEDVTWRRKDLDFTKKVLAPRGGPFSFRYPVPAGVDAPDASALLGKLLEEYHRTGYPGVFRLARTGSVFHIVPRRAGILLGSWSHGLRR